MKLEHDGVIHHPPGGGSHVFKKGFVEYLVSQLKKDEVRISIGAQPNSSPHFGTMIVFCLAFALGKLLLKCNNRLKVSVFFEVVDTAPGSKQIIDGVEYQLSLRNSDLIERFMPEYKELLQNLVGISGVNFSCRNQEQFNSGPAISPVIQKLVKHKEEILAMIDPLHKKLKIRLACPECGLTDIYTIRNEYDDIKIRSYCPKHGWVTTDIVKEHARFEYNTPLRNLVRALVYAAENNDAKIDYEWLRVTGSEYAGFYQEQMLYRCASVLGYETKWLPVIVYAPLVLDWSGAKLSKTLYLKDNAYSYLPEYLVNYNHFRQQFGKQGIEKLFMEIKGWLMEPYKLFRHYSVYYFMRIFET